MVSVLEWCLNIYQPWLSDGIRISDRLVIKLFSWEVYWVNIFRVPFWNSVFPEVATVMTLCTAQFAVPARYAITTKADRINYNAPPLACKCSRQRHHRTTSHAPNHSVPCPTQKVDATTVTMLVFNSSHCIFYLIYCRTYFDGNACGRGTCFRFGVWSPVKNPGKLRLRYIGI